jgi:spore germination protein GerM
MFSLWGFITLVLVVVVFLLINERAEQRRASMTPAGAVTARPATAASPSETPAGENERQVQLYFALGDATGLAPENRAIPFGDSSVANCRAALEALLSGPRDGGLAPIAPSTTSVRAVYSLEGGRLIVDLSRELAQGLPRSAAAEALFVQSLAHTLSQAQLRTADGQRVNSVRILIEGFPAANSFNSHLDLSDFITPDPTWVRAARPAA